MQINWIIVAIVAAIAVMLYWFTRKKTLPVQPVLVPAPIAAAPGVSANSGYTPPVAPPPPPSGVDAPIRARASLLSMPSQVLSQLPIIGGLNHAIIAAPRKIVTGTLDTVDNVLAHVPIVGGIAAAPGRVASKVLNSVGSIFGF